jgi:uncharacterized membrane protein required for colicin V production
MTIWLLAILLLASLAGLGYRQGAVRVACSLLGIILGALLAVPLGHLITPIFKPFGVKNPTLLWVLGPFVVFIIFSAVAKIVGHAVHTKVDVYFKYKTSELKQTLYERLNRRVGLCVGLLNATVYLIAICWIIYAFSYWTVQVATSDSDPWTVRFLNTMGNDLQKSGFIKVAAAVDHMKPQYYESADVAGLIYNNPLAEARLSRYPGLLDLGERPEFQTLASDTSFSQLRSSRAPIMDVIHNGAAQGILGNPDLLRTIWTTMTPDFKDLTNFLKTAESPKYDAEKILGRWNLNINVTMAAYRRAHPTVNSKQMSDMKKYMIAAFSKATFVATPGHLAILKSIVPTKATGTPGLQNLQGQWQSLDGGKYNMTFAAGGGNEDLAASIEGDRLTIKYAGQDLVFDREV